MCQVLRCEDPKPLRRFLPSQPTTRLYQPRFEAYTLARHLGSRTTHEPWVVRDMDPSLGGRCARSHSMHPFPTPPPAHASPIHAITCSLGGKRMHSHEGILPRTFLSSRRTLPESATSRTRWDLRHRSIPKGTRAAKIQTQAGVVQVVVGDGTLLRGCAGETAQPPALRLGWR